MKPAITEPQQDTEIFFCCSQFPFPTGTLSLGHRDYKSFPLNAGFGYNKFPLNTGSLFFLRRIMWSDEYIGVNSHNYIVLVNANGSEPHILSLLLGR